MRLLTMAVDAALRERSRSFANVQRLWARRKRSLEVCGVFRRQDRDERDVCVGFVAFSLPR